MRDAWRPLLFKLLRRTLSNRFVLSCGEDTSHVCRHRTNQPCYLITVVEWKRWLGWEDSCANFAFNDFTTDTAWSVTCTLSKDTTPPVHRKTTNTFPIGSRNKAVGGDCRRAIIVPMDITKMLAELKQEREAVTQAILVLERIALGQGKRRGRPPKWMTGSAPPARDGARTFTRSAATRARMAASQRKRWAKRKRANVGA